MCMILHENYLIKDNESIDNLYDSYFLKIKL